MKLTTIMDGLSEIHDSITDNKSHLIIDNAIIKLTEQRKQIRKLEKEITELHEIVKAEAIKEFANKLNEEITRALESNFNARSRIWDNNPEYMTDPTFIIINGKISALTGLDIYVKSLVAEMGDDNNG